MLMLNYYSLKVNEDLLREQVRAIAKSDIDKEVKNDIVEFLTSILEQKVNEGRE